MSEPYLERVTACGQIKQGDKLVLVVGYKGTLKIATAKMVLCSGPKEEIVYQKRKNYYFATRLVLSGTSWVKEVYIVRNPQEAGDEFDSEHFTNDGSYQ